MHGTPTLEPIFDSRASMDATRISERINAERLVLLAWTRAVLLQFMHPLIAAGVHEHSGFRSTPLAALKRLRHTVRAMLSLTFGDDAARTGVLEHIRAIHARVNGTLPINLGPYRAGTPYSAEDPALVLWVHTTLIDSIVSFYERIAMPLTAAERDRYCAEAAPVAAALGAGQALIPRSWAALQTYQRQQYDSGQLVVGPHARELADHLLAPPFGPLGAPGTSLNRIVTLGTLPALVRHEYGFAWTDKDERSFSRVIGSLRLARRLLPRQIATWPVARPRRRIRSDAPRR